MGLLFPLMRIEFYVFVIATLLQNTNINLMMDKPPL